MATITLKGNPIQTIGELPPVGTQAPDFIMTRNDLSEVRLHDCLGKITILNIFPSLDTPTCAATMQRFNDIIDHHQDLQVLCISADLPFAQERFCAAKHLDNVIPVSIFRNTNFGKLYGVLITDGPLAGLLSRAIVVLDKKGKIVHTELVKELADEPNYQPIIDYIKAC